MTPDIVKLRAELPTLEPIIDRLELQLVDDPSWDEPSDTSYLTDADRTNPDIAANVDAMAETNKLIAWFGRDAGGYLGLWRGPQDRSLAEAPVVRLDTEGQYSIVAATVPEYLAIAMPEDEFAATRDALTRAGFKVGFNPDAIWGALEAFDDDPNVFRAELYERNRVARGLARTDEQEHEHDHEHDHEHEHEHDHEHEHEHDHDEEATRVDSAPLTFATGSMPSIPAAGTQPDDDVDDFDDDDDDGAGEVDIGDDGGDEDDDEGEDEEPPPLAAAPIAQQPAPAATRPARTAGAPVKKAAAKAPAKKTAAKAPAKKAAAKAPAKKAAAKPAKKAAGKASAKNAKPLKKAAAKPAKKAAAKPAKKAAAKPAKKAAAKPAKKAAAKPAKKATKPAAKKRT